VDQNSKLLTYVMFATAIALSAVAEYYSIIGLIAIFAASPIAVGIMGAVLGIAKLVTVSWLFRNWKNAPKLLKYYFIVAITILMFITSLGIFGFMSKAHGEQSLVTSSALEKVSVYDEKILASKSNIEQSRKALKQLDESVDQIMARSTSEAGASKAAGLRRSQQAERKRLLENIEAEQKRVLDLTEESAPSRTALRQIEAEVGPLKYIAKFIYGEASTEILDKSVTWVIILLIFVFDPLAVLMMIAANYSLRAQRMQSYSKPDAAVFEPVPMTMEELETVTKL
jgi:hypothetical protein